MHSQLAFGAWLKQQRRALDRSREQLAGQVGCSISLLEKLETGERRPSRAMAERIALCLAIPAEQRSSFIDAARAGHALPDRGQLPTPTPPTAGQPPHTSHLPAPLNSFIGREWEVDTIGSRLRAPEVRLVTLTGTGGVGKTRLAIEICRTLQNVFVDGIWFVNLAPVSDPALVLPTIAQTLGIREQPDTALAATLRAALHEQCLLLLLDNFEQVVAAVLELTALLADLPQLKLLVTSREALRVYGEHVVVVAPLAVPKPATIQAASQLQLADYAAIQLFAERAHAASEQFRVQAANAAAIAALCARLDGLPLAIELAAAQSALFSPAALLTRLEQQPLHARGPRDLPARQQTLHATIAWSYDLLNAKEQQLFRRLAVFVGGCTSEAAAAVCADLGEPAALALEGIVALLDKSLLRQVEPEPAMPRLVMLETIREFAQEQLTASGEEQSVRYAHALHYLALAEIAEQELASGQRETWVQRLEQEYSNLRAALIWSQSMPDGAVLVRLAGALWWFWHFSGSARTGRQWLETALASVAGQAAGDARAKALCGAGALADHQGDHPTARVWLAESISLYRALRHQRGLGYALMYLGLVVGHQSDHQAARTAFEESIDILHRAGDRWGLALATQYLGEIDWRERDYVTAQARFEESAQLFHDLGDRWGHARALALVGFVLHSLGEDERARPCFEESGLVIRAIGDKFVLAALLNKQGQVLYSLNEHDQASACFSESIALFQELGNRQWIGDPLRNLGLIALHRGDIAQAASDFIECIKLEYDWDNEIGVAICLAGLAGVATAQDQHERAAQLFGSAAAQTQASLGQIDPAVQRHLQQILATIQARCDPISFAAAWAAGQAMPIETALAYAQVRI